MRYVFKRGKKYLANVKLDLGEMGFGNEILEHILRLRGFENVNVWGGGAVRHITATWGKDDSEIDLPDEISNLREANGQS